MKTLTIANGTKSRHGNYKVVEGGRTIEFTNRSMLINEGNGMQNGNATLCEDKGDGEINCYIGQAKDFKQNPVILTKFRTVSLKASTVSFIAPFNQQQPTKTQWISADEENTACGAFGRYGESSKWCIDPLTGKQPENDAVRTKACLEDFKTSQDDIRAQLTAYTKQLAK